ncbi:MAG TPA: hypothetical protein VFK57_17860 [Vicinamibacterales bacterium]|nr:hypothetical protein [Vicinamibacterales bacterium]
MADKWNRDDDEPMTGAADERVRGVADDEEFDDMDADDLDAEEEEDEEGATF